MDDLDHSTTQTVPEPTAAARPGWILVGNSLVVIAICIFLTSVGLSAFASMWDPCALASGSVLSLMSVVTGLLQYRATFRCNPDSAGKIGILFYIGGGFSLFTGVIALADGIPVAKLLPMLGPLFLIGAYGVGCGWLNRRWSQTLCATDSAQNAASDDDRPFQFSLRELFALVTVVVIVLGLTSYLIQNMPPRFAEGVSPDDAPIQLPDEATDVAFCRGIGGSMACEFTIDEEGFIAWANTLTTEFDEKNIALERLDGSSTRKIIRCYGMLKQMEGPEYAEITDGYYCESESRGRKLAYDRTTHRAYNYVSGN